MNATKHIRLILGLLLAALLPTLSASARSVDVKFPLVKIGTKFYTNATVTSVERDFICIMHSQGMGSFRVDELSGDLRTQLGCDTEPKKETVVATTGSGGGGGGGGVKGWLDRNIYDQKRGGLKGPIIVAFLAYCLVCLICQAVFARAICIKVGMQPTRFIYYPGFQWFQLYEAAGMSRNWAYLHFVPIQWLSKTPSLWMLVLAFCAVEFLVGVIWCINITRARGKNPFLAILLLLPLIDLIVWGYLAYSKGDEDEAEAKPVEKRQPIMTLETA